MRTLPTLLMICLLATFAGAALASTPDGDPPSVETVCTDAGLSGAAWGLCNAFCEAMDCECYEPGAPVGCIPNASENACERVLGNYGRKTSVPMPCLGEPATCPCLNANTDPTMGDLTKWSTPVNPTWIDAASWNTTDNPLPGSLTPSCTDIGGIFTLSLTAPGPVTDQAGVITDGDNSECFLQDNSVDGSSVNDSFAPITAAEAAACKVLLEDICP